MRKELASIELFSELDSAELSAIEPFLESRDVVDAGDAVIRENVEEGRCFFITSGSGRCSSRSAAASGTRTSASLSPVFS